MKANVPFSLSLVVAVTLLAIGRLAAAGQVSPAGGVSDGTISGGVVTDSNAPKVGDTYTAMGTVYRILTWNDNTTTPCMAVILQDDEKAFEAWVRAYDNAGLKKYSASALCDTLEDAFESQKKVQVAGVIEETGTSGELGNLAVSYINYLDGYTFGSNEDVPTSGAVSCDSRGDCSGNGRVTRVLNWKNNSTTLCMAIIKTAADGTIKAFVRQPTNYSSLSSSQKDMVAHSMLKACHALSIGLSSQKPTYVSGTLEADKSLKVRSVNVLLTAGSWGSELPRAF